MICKQPEQSTKKERKKERERERVQSERIVIYIIYRYRMDGFSRHYDPNNHPTDENDPYMTLIPGISCPVSSHA